MTRSEDDAWRAIVENYGDRPEIEPEASPSRPPEPARPDVPEPEELLDWDDEPFVPPPPEPLPRVAPHLAAAWVGVLGSPAVLLASLLLGISLPGWLGYLLVAAFVGGFVSLVAFTPRVPRDPGDDGARL